MRYHKPRIDATKRLEKRSIIDQDDTEHETKSIEMAREAFRKGKMVRIVQETTLFTKHSSILISVVSEME
jgi:hypothetical protein